MQFASWACKPAFMVQSFSDVNGVRVYFEDCIDFRSVLVIFGNPR